MAYEQVGGKNAWGGNFETDNPIEAAEQLLAAGDVGQALKALLSHVKDGGKSALKAHKGADADEPAHKSGGR